MPPEMSNKEAIQMMQRCINEIEHFRTQVSSLAPKAEAYDLINKIVGFVPGGSQGYGEDLVWTLRKRIEELTPKEPADAK